MVNAGSLFYFTVMNVLLFVEILWDDKDNKYPNENIYVQELLHVWYTKSNYSPIHPILKNPKVQNLKV